MIIYQELSIRTQIQRIPDEDYISLVEWSESQRITSKEPRPKSSEEWGEELQEIYPKTSNRVPVIAELKKHHKRPKKLDRWYI